MHAVSVTIVIASECASTAHSFKEANNSICMLHPILVMQNCIMLANTFHIIIAQIKFNDNFPWNLKQTM